MSARSDFRCAYQGERCSSQCWGCQRDEQRPEAAVIDAIDELDAEIAAGDQSQPFFAPLADECPRCGGEWHGLPVGRCPGAYGDDSASPAAQGDQPAAAGLFQQGYAYAREQGQIIIDEILGAGHHVPPFGAIGAEPPWVVFEAEPPGRLVPLPESMQIIQGPPTGFDELERVMRIVIEMLAEVCGIRLSPNDFDGAISAVQEMTQAARERRQRHDRIRCALLTDAAPPSGYTLADIERMREDLHATDDRRQAVQGLRERRDHNQASARDRRQRRTEAGAALRDARASEEEAQ